MHRSGESVFAMERKQIKVELDDKDEQGIRGEYSIGMRFIETRNSCHESVVRSSSGIEGHQIHRLSMGAS